MDWLKEKYPEYGFVFIPANCTGVMQPADVLLQRPLKHEFRNQYTEWTTQQIRNQIKAGTERKLVNIDTDLKTLKPHVTGEPPYWGHHLDLELLDFVPNQGPQVPMLKRKAMVTMTRITHR